MKEFSASPSKDVSLFLVCTDRASRGIEFTRVDHVILFNFLRNLSEYVRRVGRTARGSGGKGKAFVLAVGKHSLARGIMVRNWKGHTLHDLLSAYELMSWDVRAPSGIEFMLGVTGIDPISPFFFPAFYRGMAWQEMKM